MIENYSAIIKVLFPLILMLIGTLFAVLVDSYIENKHKRIMSLILFFVFSLITQNLLEFYFEVRGDCPFGRILMGIYGYAIRPFIILLFSYLVNEKKKFLAQSWCLVIINALIFMTALFSDIAFTVDKHNSFHRGPFGFSAHIISLILLFNLMLVSLTKFNSIRRAEELIPVLNVGLIVASVIMDSYFSGDSSAISYLTISSVISTVFYYIWLHLQFVRNHENALMADQRIKIMMSQIQPHFLYNTLSTIQSLCMIDSEKAADVTENFGTYLRQNLEALNQTDLIPIEKEIEHTKVYSEIEQVRFPKIQVIYDIEDTSFGVPALTVQPLVENAIRHGVRGKKDGFVKVATRDRGDYHEIIVEDNGKGFDVDGIKNLEGTHIGTQNVKDRVREMCHGSVVIKSTIGEGTIITINIPHRRREV